MKRAALLLAWTTAAAAALDACAVPSTQLLRATDTCATLNGVASPALDIAGAGGEMEYAQVVVMPGGSDVYVKPSFTGAVGDAVSYTREVGYVNCEATTRYGGSGGGWTSDPLLDIDASKGTLLNTTQPVVLWVALTLPRTPGVLQGSLEIVDARATDGAVLASIPITVTVWAMPPLPSYADLQRDFMQIINLNIDNVWDFYNTSQADHAGVAEAWSDFFRNRMLPPDVCYASNWKKAAPRGEYLAASGSSYIAVPNAALPVDECDAGLTDAMVAAALDDIDPYVSALLALLDDTTKGYTFTPYFYMFDEKPEGCSGNIRKVFNAVHHKWGGRVATIATLNWALPADLPVDVWDLQYQLYPTLPADAIAAWRATGKKLIGYHCIEPSAAGYLNSFIEHPRTQLRQLYWYAVSVGYDGWLYYATVIWRPHPGSTHKPLERIGASAFTDFPPANYIWSPRTDIFANGDGQFMYPGTDAAAPLPTARLEIWRDAVEDRWLLAQALAKDEAATRELIAKIVRSPTDHTDSPTLLEGTRRQVAGIIMGDAQ